MTATIKHSRDRWQHWSSDRKSPMENFDNLMHAPLGAGLSDGADAREDCARKFSGLTHAVLDST